LTYLYLSVAFIQMLKVSPMVDNPSSLQPRSLTSLPRPLPPSLCSCPAGLSVSHNRTSESS
jgi:hypothetical protein